MVATSGAASLEPATEGVARREAERHPALLVALAHDPEDPVVEVDVVEVEPGELADPDARWRRGPRGRHGRAGGAGRRRQQPPRRRRGAGPRPAGRAPAAGSGAAWEPRGGATGRARPGRCARTSGRTSAATPRCGPASSGRRPHGRRRRARRAGRPGDRTEGGVVVDPAPSRKAATSRAVRAHGVLGAATLGAQVALERGDHLVARRTVTPTRSHPVGRNATRTAAKSPFGTSRVDAGGGTSPACDASGSRLRLSPVAGRRRLAPPPLGLLEQSQGLEDRERGRHPEGVDPGERRRAAPAGSRRRTGAAAHTAYSRGEGVGRAGPGRAAARGRRRSGPASSTTSAASVTRTAPCLADELVAAGRGRAGDRPGHGPDRQVVLARLAGGGRATRSAARPRRRPWPRASVAMTRLRARKRPRCGATPGGTSLTTAPEPATASMSALVGPRVGARSTPQASTATVVPSAGQRATVRGGVDAERRAADDGPPPRGQPLPELGGDPRARTRWPPATRRRRRHGR